MVERNIWAVVNQVVRSVCHPTYADVSTSIVMDDVTDVGEGDFAEDAAVWLGREHLIGAQMEAHPVVSTKEERASPSLVGDNVHSYC